MRSRAVQTLTRRLPTCHVFDEEEDQTEMTTSEPTSPTTEPSSVGSWTTIRAVLVAVVVCEGVGALAGGATQTSVDTWYPTLTKPWFTPPDWLFAPV